MNTDLLKLADDALAVLTPEATEAQFLDFTERLAALKKAVKDFEARAKPLQIAWLKAHRQASCGTVEYRAGFDKDVDCINPAGTFEALLVACEGDINRVAAHLCASPWKVGECRKTLPPAVFDQCFETTPKDVLKVKRLDTKYLK